jgi:hypothetical protein
MIMAALIGTALLLPEEGRYGKKRVQVLRQSICRRLTQPGPFVALFRPPSSVRAPYCLGRGAVRTSRTHEYGINLPVELSRTACACAAYPFDDARAALILPLTHCSLHRVIIFTQTDDVFMGLGTGKRIAEMKMVGPGASHANVSEGALTRIISALIACLDVAHAAS